jgi:hypothetical protein
MAMIAIELVQNGKKKPIAGTLVVVYLGYK